MTDRLKTFGAFATLLVEGILFVWLITIDVGSLIVRLSGGLIKTRISQHAALFNPSFN